MKLSTLNYIINGLTVCEARFTLNFVSLDVVWFVVDGKNFVFTNYGEKQDCISVTTQENNGSFTHALFSSTEKDELIKHMTWRCEIV